MSLPTGECDDQHDWEMTPEGLYMATRSFLVRRGYCCANRCRNCPYVNWREDPTWQHAPGEKVRRITVSRRSLEGASLQLTRHQQALEETTGEDQDYHLDMITHYRLLLEYWR